MTTFKDLKVGQEVRITDTFNNPQGTRYRMTVTEGTVRHVGLNGSQHRAVVDGLTVQETQGHETVIEILKDVPKYAPGLYRVVLHGDSRKLLREVREDGGFYDDYGVRSSIRGDAYSSVERIHTYDPETQVVVEKSDLPTDLEIPPPYGRSRHEQINWWHFIESNHSRNVALRALAKALDKQEEEGV